MGSLIAIIVTRLRAYKYEIQNTNRHDLYLVYI